jgi:putative ABC transport system permease protein
MQGSRAVVRGVCGDVRTITASPFVFTSIKAGLRYDLRYRDDEITYVLVRGRDGWTPEQVRDAVAREVPSAEALTAREFTVRTMAYWMLKTGIGLSVVVTAVLGLTVGGVVMSQTLLAVTHDNLHHYAALLALGFGRGRLAAVVLTQGLALGTGGVVLGGAGFAGAARISAPTTLPLQMNAAVFGGLVGLALVGCLLAALASLRPLFRVDPVTVFRG